MELDKEWPWRILWTVETHFHPTGYINTQKWWIWAAENPLKLNLCFFTPAKFTVWWGFTASFIGPYFFKETGVLSPVIVTVTTQRFECLLSEHFFVALQQRGCVDRINFMKDGDPPGIAIPVKQLLKRYFRSARIISRHFLTVWPSQPPHLNSCDFWL